MPTINDVARTAAVSIATVSRVLSQPALVTEATRRRVLAAIAELDYRPNASARALRTLRSARLLVTVPDIGNPFFAAVLRGAEEEARGAGFAVIVGETGPDGGADGGYADLLQRREVDGLILLGHRLPDAARALVGRAGAPAPVVNGCEYSPDLALPSVHIDNVAAGAEAAEHLLNLGHRRIGIVAGPLAGQVGQDRLRGAREAIVARGGTATLVEAGGYTVACGAEAAAPLLGEGCTAVFCFSDELAIGALRAIHEAGLRCPQDISVVGFDDVRFAAYLTPSLTTIAQPTRAIGARCVRLLVDILATGIPARPGPTILPHRLMVRESTAAPTARALPFTAP